MNIKKSQHPKVYIAIDKQEVEELKDKIREYRAKNNPQRAEGMQEAIDWIKAHDIYTRPWDRDEKE